MKKFLTLPLLLIVSSLHAQYTLRLTIIAPGTKDIFLAGNFNNWNPADSAWHLPTNKTITLNNISPGTWQFKSTRGSWASVETTAKGADIANREITIHSDTSLTITIEGWKDQFINRPKHNTASAQVHIIDTAFFIPQLDRHRRIWVYLPKTYQQNKNKRYPVLYMQDGQNLFDEQTAPFGEWGIDECLDTIQQQTGKECIIVGIDHGGDKRTTEYNPYDNQQYGKGEGRQYAAFLATTLKPFIDAKFRTLKDAQHTYIAGSSLGALIALYTIMKYPQVFGTAGIFSPAFWIAPTLNEDLQKTTWKPSHRFYFYAGEKESEHMITDMDKIINILKPQHSHSITRSVDLEGRHSEKYWRQYFPGFYTWLIK